MKNPVGGPPVLLIHGNPGTLADFADLAPRLDLASEVLAIELPGFGGSPLDPTRELPSTLSALAEVAFSIVEPLGWERFDVIGHSHGAGIAQAMAWLRSERIDELLLLGSLGLSAHLAYRQLTAPGAKWAISLMARCLRLPGGKAWLRALQRGVVNSAFFPELAPKGRLESEVARMLAEPQILVRMAELAGARPCADLATNAVSIASPTHFMHGAADRLVPARYAHAIHERRIESGRASSFELIEDAGHMLPLTHAAHIAERYRALRSVPAQTFRTL